MTLQITTETNQYRLRIPAHRYWQGKRCVYYFPLDVQSLDGLLPQRVDEGLIKQANRRLTPSHAKNIQDYLRERGNWLLGAMMLGISPDGVEFDTYKDENGRPNINFGELRILANHWNTMKIFDGQHRRRAIGDLLLEFSEQGEEGTEIRGAFLNSSVPIVLYAEEDQQSLKQMFADASKTKRIEASTVTVFDQRDAINLAAIRLAEKSRLFHGRIEMERTSVAANSSSLLSINQLAAILRALEVGIRGRISRDRNEDYMQDLDTLHNRCLNWSDEFLFAAREEYDGLANGQIDNDEIPVLRSKSLAFSATFIRILAGCFQDLRRKGIEDWTPLAHFVRAASLRPGDGQGSLLVDAGVMAPGDSSPVARRQEVQGAIDYIVATALARST